jgi:Na+-driven multidrug efflux pump
MEQKMISFSFRNNKENINTIFVLAIPVIVENILQTLLGTVAVYFAGTIDDKAIAAIGVTNLIINLFIAFYTAVSIGTGAVVSRNFGKNDITKANSAIKQSILLGTFLGLLFEVINLIFYKPILMIRRFPGP